MKKFYNLGTWSQSRYVRIFQGFILLMNYPPLFLGIPCPAGQEYQVCPNECTRTCSNIANDPTCKQSGVCAEGCGCPANQTLDDNGHCIDIQICPCKFNGQDYTAGTTVERGDQVWYVSFAQIGNFTLSGMKETYSSSQLTYFKRVCFHDVA